MTEEELANAWALAKSELDSAKERELELRLKITPLLLKQKIEGSVTEQFGTFKLTATASLNYKIDEEALDRIEEEDLTEEEWACIKFKPVVVPAKFRDLPEDSKLQQIVTAKPGMPQLRILGVMLWQK